MNTQSIRAIISQIRQDLNSVAQDTWIPAKYIYITLVDVANKFIKREADDKRLFRYVDLWATIKCLEMVEDDLINCCDISIPNCTTVMRSKNKLPEIYTTRFGYLMNVLSLDYGKDYTPTTPQQYKYTKSRTYQDKSKRYFWIENGYLIIPDAMVSRVTVRAMFFNKAEALKADCNAGGDNCIRFLDGDFIAPKHLMDDIKTATMAKIAQRLAIPPDEMQNMNSYEKTNQTSL